MKCWLALRAYFDMASGMHVVRLCNYVPYQWFLPSSRVKIPWSRKAVVIIDYIKEMNAQIFLKEWQIWTV